MRAISLMLERTLSHILVVLMGVIVINVSWQVITRFIMNSPSSFTEELARFLLIWIGFLGGSYAYARRSHLSLDLLLQSVAEKHKPLLLQISNVFCFAFAAAVLSPLLSVVSISTSSFNRSRASSWCGKRTEPSPFTAAPFAILVVAALLASVLVPAVASADASRPSSAQDARKPAATIDRMVSAVFCLGTI